MSSKNEPTFDDVVKQLKKNTGSTGRLTSALDNLADHLAGDFDKVLANNRAEEKRERDRVNRQKKDKRDEFHRKVDDQTRKVVSSFKLLEGEGTGVSSAFSLLTKTMVNSSLGIVVDEVIQWSTKSISTYRSLAEAGDSFSGGLFYLSRAAAESGMSLDAFAKFAIKNTELSKRIGHSTGDLGKWASAVREGTEKVGMYGYSVESLNDITAEYATREANFGRADKLTKKEVIDSSIALAAQTAGLSEVFGKSRKAIMEDADHAMQNATFLAYMQQRTGEEFAAGNKAIKGAIQELAASPGEAGKVMSEMLAETAATGNAALTQGANLFVNAGMPSVLGIMDKAANDLMKDGADKDQITADLMHQMVDQYDANIQSLQQQAAAGNQNAKQLIIMMTKTHDQWKHITAKELKEAADEAKNKAAVNDAYSAKMLALSNKFARVEGILKEKLLPVFSILAVVVGNAMDAFADALQVAATPLDAVGAAFSFVSKIVGGATSAFENFTGIFGSAGTAVGGVVEGLVKFGLALGTIYLATKTMSKSLGLIPKVIGGLLRMSGLGGLGQKLGLGKLLGSASIGTLTVNARKVIVNGGGGSSLGGLFGGDEHEGKGPHGEHSRGKGRFGRFFGGLRDRFGGMAKSKGITGKVGGLLGLLGGGETLFGMFHHDGGDKQRGGAEGHDGDDETLASPKDKEADPAGAVDPKSEKTPGGGAAGKVGSAVEEAEHVAEKSGARRFLSSAGKILGHSMKAIRGVALAIGAYKAGTDVYDIVKGKKSITDALKDVIPTALGAVGGAVGGIVGGAGGTLVLPGAGTAVGGIAGATAGGAGGEALGDWIVSKLFGAAKDDASKKADPAGVKDQPPQDGLEKQIDDMADDLKKNANGDPDVLTDKLAVLINAVNQQTAILAGQNKKKMDQDEKARQLKQM